jgi:phosphoribosyl-dephospho-CoA transferase
MGFGLELKNLVLSTVGSLGGNDFQQAMKQNHQLAMEYIARLLRRTVNHNGPVKRHEIDPWLRNDAVMEIRALLYPSSSARAADDDCIPQYRWGFRH